MARRKPGPARKPERPMPGDLNNPQSLGALMTAYLEYLEQQNFSKVTIKGKRLYLLRFGLWCDERGITLAKEVSTEALKRYRRHLFYHRTAQGRPLSFSTQHTYLNAILSLFSWLARIGHILFDPGASVELPKTESSLPAVLTAPEMERILAVPDVNDMLGIRDRAIMETFYSTGIRRQELGRLRVNDLDINGGTLFVRLGKGKKDRMVPIGERAIAWILKYLDESRPHLALEPDNGFLFLSSQGAPLSTDAAGALVSRHLKTAEIEKPGACHLIRHTMATAMLENGADIRYIQHMLGHANLTSTQIYTHVSIRKLKEIHAETHPARLHKSIEKPLEQQPVLNTESPESAEDSKEIEDLFTVFYDDMKDDWTN